MSERQTTTSPTDRASTTGLTASTDAQGAAAPGSPAVQMRAALSGRSLGAQIQMLTPRGGPPAPLAPGVSDVQRSAGEAPTAAKEAPRGLPIQRRAVQRLAVQREETPPQTTTTPTPNTTTTEGGDQESDANASTEPVLTVPQTYEDYTAYIETRFAAEFAHLKQLNANFVSQGGEAKRVHEQLDVHAAELAQLQAEYKANGDKLDEEKAARMKVLTAIAPLEGATMPKLLAEARALLERHGNKKIKVQEDKDRLEAIMNAAMELSEQTDPDGTGYGRDLYSNKIDEAEHAAMIAKAAQEGAPPAKQAELAVNYRNWLRKYFRLVVMSDQQCSEILFLRDKGKVGSTEGQSFEFVMQSVIKKLTTPNEETKEQVLRSDFTMETATEEEKLKVYEAMINSAKTTNAGVNSSAGVKKEEQTGTSNEQNVSPP